MPHPELLRSLCVFYGGITAEELLAGIVKKKARLARGVQAPSATG